MVCTSHPQHAHRRGGRRVHPHASVRGEMARDRGMRIELSHNLIHVPISLRQSTIYGKIQLYGKQLSKLPSNKSLIGFN